MQKLNCTRPTIKINVKHALRVCRKEHLDPSHKLRFISVPLKIRCLQHKQDKAIFTKVTQCDNHPLKAYFPQENINVT